MCRPRLLEAEDFSAKMTHPPVMDTQYKYINYDLYERMDTSLDCWMALYTFLLIMNIRSGGWQSTVYRGYIIIYVLYKCTYIDGWPWIYNYCT